MKCTQCGNSNLNKVRISHSEGGYFEGVSSYACSKCGHIEWFLDNSTTVKQSNLIRQKEQDELGHKIREEEALLVKKFNDEVARLDKIINDENQTMKAINEAKKQKEILEKNHKKRQKPSGTPFGW
jgi:hypothetical protein